MVASALALAAAAPAYAQSAGSIRGRVTTDRATRPVVGAQVLVVGTQIGTVTNSAGDFLLLNVPAGSQTVQVQMLGYRTVEQAVVVTAGQVASVTLDMQQEALALDAVVVTGTAGQARRREVGNSIAQIDLSEVEEPVANVDALLQARTAGINVNMGSATMGAGAAIRLRGNVSVSQGNQPLVYVDGVRQGADAYPRNVSENGSFFSGSNSEASPLGDINPSDIERIEILKGAAAATLYGTEAAAGVIQIFTKKGVQGDAVWTYQTDQSLTWIRPYGSDTRPLLRMDPWLQTGYGQKHNLSVRGGSDRSQYFVSAALDRGEGVLPTDEETRYGVRANVSFRPAETLTFDWSSFFSKHDFATSPVGNNGEGLFFNVYRAPNNPLGSERKEDIDRLLEMETSQVNDRTILGLTTNWAPRDGISSRLTLGYDQAASHQQIFHPYGFITVQQGDISDVRWQAQALTVDYTANMEFGLGEAMRSTFSVGGQLVRREEARLDGFGRGLPGPGQHTLSSAAERYVSESEIRVNTGGFFFQNLFNVRDRYFLTAGLRVDGNSAFGEDFGLQPYPKVSGSYVISDEEFWPESLGQVKLRGAFGYAGRAPGAFDAVRTWSPSSFAGRTAFSPLNLGNPELGPEKTAELEVGFDGSFLNDRLTVDFTYYAQKTDDALFPVAQAPSNGFLGSQLENVGSLKNTGIEVVLNGTVLERESFVWDLGSTISTNRSEILETGASSSFTLVEGQPAPVIRGAKVKNKDAFEDPEFELNAFFGPNQPTLILGVSTRLQLPYGVVLAARGEYQGGHWTSDFPSRLVAQRGPYGAVGCDDVYKIVPWGEYDGPGDDHPNLGQVRALDRARCYRRSRSDVWNMPADFFKLREITAQAPIPFEIPGVRSAFVTASARNLWRWVNDEFASFDPEINANRSQINGLTLTISDQLPPPASATLSVRVTF